MVSAPLLRAAPAQRSSRRRGCSAPPPRRECLLDARLCRISVLAPAPCVCVCACVRVCSLCDAPACMQTGELFDYIVEKGRLMEDEARHFFQQIISGVE